MGARQRGAGTGAAVHRRTRVRDLRRARHGRVAPPRASGSARVCVPCRGNRPDGARPAAACARVPSPALQLPRRMADSVHAVFCRSGVELAAVQMKNRLRALRAERNWSQADLAEKLGVSRQTVNAVETERYEPSLSLSFKVARLFAMTIEDIFQPEQ